MNRMLLVFLAGLAAGAMNAMAGGGSFLSVPALIHLGVPSVAANMSSTIALYPGSLTSAWAFRRNFQEIFEVPLKQLVLATLAGGLAGALLLLITPTSSFDKVIPWLLLLGSTAFAFGGPIGAWLAPQRAEARRGPRPLRHYRPKTTAAWLISQFLLGIYGGYFGGAVGIMMMAFWSIAGVQDVKAMNAVKVVLVAAANAVAVLCFAVAGSVAWRETLVMLMAAAAGGYLGARLALRLSPWRIRCGISVLNFVITGLFFYAKFFR